jgi:hypothetical protein
MGKALLIGQREPDDFGLFEGSMCGLLENGHNEIGHCTPLKFSNVLEHRMEIRTYPGLETSGRMGCSHSFIALQ